MKELGNIFREEIRQGKKVTTLKPCRLIEYIFMENSCRKCAPKSNPRFLFNFSKYPKTAIVCKKLF